MIIKKLYCNNAFGLKNVEIDLKQGQILFVREDLDDYCEKEFFFMCKCLFDDEYYVSNINSNGNIGYIVEKFDSIISLNLSRIGQEERGEIFGAKLVGYKENIETTLLFDENINGYFRVELNENFRNAVFKKQLRDYCFCSYDTLYCLLEVLYDKLKTGVEKPSATPEFKLSMFNTYKKLLAEVKTFKLSKDTYMFFDHEGKRYYKNGKGELLKDIDDKDENFAEFVDFYFANKIIQEICVLMEYSPKYPIFFRRVLSNIKEEQVSLAITMLKDLNTQIILCEELEFEEYKDQFDVYLDM